MKRQGWTRHQRQRHPLLLKTKSSGWRRGENCLMKAEDSTCRIVVSGRLDPH